MCHCNDGYFDDCICAGRCFSGDWLGANKEGDLKVAFTLNCDGNWQLNPYNENARCNGFMEVNMLEPVEGNL